MLPLRSTAAPATRPPSDLKAAPSLSAISLAAPPHDLPILSDDDVATLFDIVAAAQDALETPDTLPFRALFAAYETVLADRGLDPSRDQIFFRYLLRLGRNETIITRGNATSSVAEVENVDLFATFEALLAQQGIQLEIGSEGDLASVSGVQPTDKETRAAQRQPQDFLQIDLSEREAPNPRPPRRRRASFSSFYDAEDESTRVLREQAASRASLSRFDGFSTDTRWRSTGPGQQHPSRSMGLQNIQSSEAATNDYAPSQPSKRSRSYKSSSDKLGKPFAGPSSPRLTTSVQPFRSDRHEAKLEKLPFRARSQPREAHVHEDNSITDRDLLSSVNFVLQNDQDLHFSQTQLFRDAGTFYHFHLRNVCREVLNKWRRTVELFRQNRGGIDTQAELFSRQAVTGRYFHYWLHARDQKRLLLETERFFAHLEVRAIKARNLYLLTKAFTHWAQTTADVVERTSVARRHVMRFRYFNAWREITAVNELKIRRQILKRFFAHWNGRIRSHWAQDQKALVVYDGNLVERIYWQWFWGFCEARAPEWYHGRLLRRIFTHWGLLLRYHQQHEQGVAVIQQARERERYFALWKDKLSSIRRQQHEAAFFRQRALLLSAFRSCATQTRLAPLAQEMATRVQHRLMARALTSLVHLHHLSLQARAVDQRKVMQHVWTDWNHRLRWQTMQRQIDDRLATQALYRWVIAQRARLLERLSRDCLRRRTLRDWTGKTRTICEHLGRQEQALGALRTRNLATAVLQIWHDKFQQQQSRSQIAASFLSPKLTRESLQVWHARYQCELELSRWSVEARYYFRATRSFRAWKNAVENKRRQNRRDAYAQVRRTLKLRLARSVMAIWLGRTQQVTEAQRQAAAILDRRETLIMASCLANFRARLQEHDEQVRFVLAYDRQRCLRHTLETWAERARHVEFERNTALAFARGLAEKVASDCVRRLQLRLLECQSLDAKARSVALWNDRRKVRALLRLWIDRSRLMQHVDDTKVAVDLPPNASTPFPVTLPTPGRWRESLAFSRLSPSVTGRNLPGHQSRSSQALSALPERKLWTSSRPDTQETTTAADEGQSRNIAQVPKPSMGFGAESSRPATQKSPSRSTSTPSKRAARARALARDRLQLSRSRATPFARSDRVAQHSHAAANPSVEVPVHRSVFASSTSYTPITNPPTRLSGFASRHNAANSGSEQEPTRLRNEMVDSRLSQGSRDILSRDSRVLTSSGTARSSTTTMVEATRKDSATSLDSVEQLDLQRVLDRDHHAREWMSQGFQTEQSSLAQRHRHADHMVEGVHRGYHRPSMEVEVDMDLDTPDVENRVSAYRVSAEDRVSGWNDELASAEPGHGHDRASARDEEGIRRRLFA